MQREEYNLNQRARALDICETHLCRRECRCDRREAEVHVARVSGTGRSSGVTSPPLKRTVSHNKDHYVMSLPK
jgi:hypothetical protein